MTGPTRFLLILLLYPFSSVIAAPSYTCRSLFVPVNVQNATSVIPPFPYPFPDGSAAVAFLNAATYRDPPPTQVNLTTYTGTFNISIEYCTPNKNKKDTIQILTHGLGFDKKYWDFRLPSAPKNTQYSYITSALAAGYSTLSWDRLGCGSSPKPDPFTVVQAPIELAVLAGLTSILRKGGIPGIAVPKKVVHVGHSWGSELSNALAALPEGPELSDGVIMTGYSHRLNFGGLFIASTNFHIASENQPKRFKNYSSGYITWGDKYANQYAFLEYGYFDPAVLAYTEATKNPMTAGEFMTQGALNYVAANFTGPVLYLAAQHDLIFCQSDCVGLFGKSSPAITAFGKSKDVEVYIQPNSGHAINIHKNATAAYGVMQAWMGKHGF